MDYRAPACRIAPQELRWVNNISIEVNQNCFSYISIFIGFSGKVEFVWDVTAVVKSDDF